MTRDDATSIDWSRLYWKVKCMVLTLGQHKKFDTSFTTQLCSICDTEFVKSGVLRQVGREFEKKRDRDSVKQGR